MNLPHLDRLLDAYVDGSLTAAERTELETLLLSSAEARGVFWSRIRLHAELRKLSRENWGRRIAQPPTAPLDSTEEPPNAASTESSPSKHITGASRSSSRRRVYFSAVFLGVVLALGGTLWRTMRPGPRVVATVEYAVRTKFSAGQTFEPGLLELSSGGIVQMRFCDGAVVVVQGPARLQLKSARQIALEKGRVQVEATEGFLVETPKAKVTDLGTRFGVSVEGDGTVEAHVFEGRLEIAAAGTTLQIGKNEAAAVEGASLRRISAQADAFPAPALEMTVPLAGAGFEPGTVVKATDPMQATAVNIPLAGAGFEPGTQVEALNTPASPGLWSGDKAEVCGLFANVMPRTGRGMLRFLHVSRLQEISVDQWQLVDVRPYQSVVGSGTALADFTAWFNGERSGEFSISVLAWHGEAESPLKNWMSRFKPGSHFSSAKLRTDGNPGSWQPATIQLPLPGNTDFLLVHVGAGRTGNAVTTAGGQFVDDTTLTLRVPPQASRAQSVDR